MKPNCSGQKKKEKKSEQSGKGKAMKIIYQENDMILEEDEGRFFLQTGKDTYRLLDQVYGPFLYLKGNGKMTAVRHAFTVEELCKAI